MRRWSQGAFRHFFFALFRVPLGLLERIANHFELLHAFDARHDAVSICSHFGKCLKRILQDHGDAPVPLKVDCCEAPIISVVG